MRPLPLATPRFHRAPSRSAVALAALLGVVLFVAKNPLLNLRSGFRNVGDSLGQAPLDGLLQRTDPKSVAPRNAAGAANDTDGGGWWIPHVQGHARVYPLRRDHGWCSARDGPGLVYVKMPKTGSSAAAAVTVQLARNVAARERPGMKACPHLVEALPNWHKIRRDPAASIQWTTLRHPARRAVSHYFFQEVSRKGKEPYSGDWRGFLAAQVNFQTTWTKNTKNISHPMNTMDPVKAGRNVQDILNMYDFIAITERMDESLVVLKLLFSLEDEDIVNMSHNKQAGGFDDGLSGAGCVRIAKSFVTAEAEEYLGGTFVTGNFDLFLYDVAVRSLDMTIDALGRELVRAEVDKLRMMQWVVTKHCEATTVFPCTEEGPPNPEARRNCFKGDWGCAHECAQLTLKQYREGTNSTGRAHADLA